jgi:hypothetical protein
MLPGFACALLMGGAVGGVVPDAVNWTGVGQNATQIISGISAPIQLRIVVTSVVLFQAGAAIYAMLDGAPAGSETLVDSVDAQFDITVADGQALYFFVGAGGYGAWYVSGSVAVKYKSAGSPTFDQTLDTFTFT